MHPSNGQPHILRAEAFACSIHFGGRSGPAPETRNTCGYAWGACISARRSSSSEPDGKPSCGVWRICPGTRGISEDFTKCDCRRSEGTHRPKRHQCHRRSMRATMPISGIVRRCQPDHHAALAEIRVSREGNYPASLLRLECERGPPRF